MVNKEFVSQADGRTGINKKASPTKALLTSNCAAHR